MTKKKIKLNSHLPTVSLCTVTYNRRPFWEYTIKCIQSQDYPFNKMEWIIIDDGTDLIEVLLKILNLLRLNIINMIKKCH